MWTAPPQGTVRGEPFEGDERDGPAGCFGSSDRPSRKRTGSVRRERCGSNEDRSDTPPPCGSRVDRRDGRPGATRSADVRRVPRIACQVDRKGSMAVLASVGGRIVAVDVPPRADDGPVAPRVDPRPLGRQAPPAGPLPQPLHRLAGRHGHRHDARRPRSRGRPAGPPAGSTTGSPHPPSPGPAADAGPGPARTSGCTWSRSSAARSGPAGRGRTPRQIVRPARIPAAASRCRSRTPR